MPLKHSLSILASRFSLTYKVLLYVFIITLIFAVIAVAAVLPALKPLTDEIQPRKIIQDVKVALVDMIKGDAQQQQVNYEKLMNDWEIVKNAFSNNAGRLAFSIVWVVIVLLLFRVMIMMCYYPVSDIVHNFMQSNSRYGFISNYLSNFAISFKYALSEFIVSIGFYAVYGLVLCGGLYLTFKLSVFFGIMITYIAYIIMVSIKRALTAFWLPTIIYEKKKVWQAFRDQFKIVKVKFVKDLGLFVMTHLLLTAFIVIFGFATFFVGFIVGGAMQVVLLQIINMVLYYRDRDHKYYIEPKKVIDAKSEIL